MNHYKYVFLAIINTLVISSGLHAQSDQEQIKAIRNASNAALRSYDSPEVLSYLTDDVLTTTGNGVLICGKGALEQYIAGVGESKMYWIRDTKEILVNEKRGLAWESGAWSGYDPEISTVPIVGGKYSAMWTKASGVWKIKSQLFVTAGEE